MPGETCLWSTRERQSGDSTASENYFPTAHLIPVGIRLSWCHPDGRNPGKISPLSDVTFGGFVKRHFVSTFLPTLRLATQNKCLSTINSHLFPAFGSIRLWRDRHARSAAIGSGQDAQWSWRGIVRSAPLPHVEGFQCSQDLEFLRGRKSWLRCTAGGGETRAGETCFGSCADSALGRCAARTMPNDGAARLVDRNADWRDSRSAAGAGNWLPPFPRKVLLSPLYLQINSAGLPPGWERNTQLLTGASTSTVEVSSILLPNRQTR